MSKEKGIVHILLIVLFLGVAVLIILIFLAVRASTTLKLKPDQNTQYQNPFNKTTPYENPFETYQNPFDQITQ